jgi:hypothetical protein
MNALAASSAASSATRLRDPRLQPSNPSPSTQALIKHLPKPLARLSNVLYTDFQQVIIFDFSGAIDPATDPSVALVIATRMRYRQGLII